MTRRDLTKAAMLGIGAGWEQDRALAGYAVRPQDQRPVTAYVADFIVNTRYGDVPSRSSNWPGSRFWTGWDWRCAARWQTGEMVRTYLKAKMAFRDWNGHGDRVFLQSPTGLPRSPAPLVFMPMTTMTHPARGHRGPCLWSLDAPVLGVSSGVGPGGKPGDAGEELLLAYNVGVEVGARSPRPSRRTAAL